MPLARAAELAPGSPLVHARLATALRGSGRDLEARVEAKKAGPDARAGLSRESQLVIEASFRETTVDWSCSAESYRILFGFFPDNVDSRVRLRARALSSTRGVPQEALPVIAGLRSLPPPSSLQLPHRQPRGEHLRAPRGCEEARVDRAGRSPEGGCSRALVRPGRSSHAARSDAPGGGELGRRADGVRAGARDVAGREDDGATETGALAAMADVLVAQGKFSEALPIYDAELARARAQGDLYRVAGILNTRAISPVLARRYRGGAARLGGVENAQATRDPGSSRGRRIRWGNLGSAYGDEGALEKAHDAHARALSLLRQIGMQSGVAEELANLVDLACTRGDLREAEEHQAELDGMLPSLSRKLLDGIGRELHAIQARQRDRLDEARGEIETALAIFEGMGAAQMANDVKVLAAEIALDQGDPQRAEALAREAGGLLSRQRHPRGASLSPTPRSRGRSLGKGGGPRRLRSRPGWLLSASASLPVLTRLEAARAGAVALADSPTGPDGAGRARWGHRAREAGRVRHGAAGAPAHPSSAPVQRRGAKGARRRRLGQRGCARRA